MVFKSYLTVKNIIFFIVAILFIKFLTTISAIAMMFFASYVLACSLNPLVELLTKRMKRPMAATVVITGMILVFSLFFIPVIVIASDQINSFIQVLPGHIANLKAFIMNKTILGQKIVDMIDIPSFIQPVSDFTTNLVNQSITVTIGIASSLIYILTMCIIMYYFIVDKRTIRRTFLTFFPKQMKKKADRIVETISKKIGGYIVAQGVTMLSVGIVFTICLLLLKVDYAVLLGLIATVLDIIPVIGPTIALIICIVMCYQIAPVTLALMVASFFLAQWVENNFVRPYVFGKFMDVHPLIIFFSIFVTAKFLGIICTCDCCNSMCYIR